MNEEYGKGMLDQHYYGTKGGDSDARPARAPEPPVLKTVLVKADDGSLTKLAAHFYDYGYYNQVAESAALVAELRQEAADAIQARDDAQSVALRLDRELHTRIEELEETVAGLRQDLQQFEKERLWRRALHAALSRIMGHVDSEFRVSGGRWASSIKADAEAAEHALSGWEPTDRTHPSADCAVDPGAASAPQAPLRATDALSSPSDLDGVLAGLRALIAQWRAKAAVNEASLQHYTAEELRAAAEVWAVARRECAQDLAARLDPGRPAPAQDSDAAVSD